jgi:hypothetical protein
VQVTANTALGRLLLASLLPRLLHGHTVERWASKWQPLVGHLLLLAWSSSSTLVLLSPFDGVTPAELLRLNPVVLGVVLGWVADVYESAPPAVAQILHFKWSWGSKHIC